jgi:hypothetical protein
MFRHRIDMGEPAWVLLADLIRRGSSVSTKLRENLAIILRQSAFRAVSNVNEQRRQLRELISAQPLHADVTVTAAAIWQSTATGPNPRPRSDGKTVVVMGTQEEEGDEHD